MVAEVKDRRSSRNSGRMDVSPKYRGLGVDPTKRYLALFKELLDSEFEGAFTTVLSHPRDRDMGFVLHVDGAGSKPVQAYLNWRELGDGRAFRGIAQDVVAMNVDDIIAVGAAPVAFADYVSLNAFYVDRGVVLRALCSGFLDCKRLLSEHGLPMKFAGGETADLPDQVGTLDVSGCVLGEVGISEVITGGSVGPGDVIVGLESGGTSSYEKVLNSGIMCNGITMARHCLLSRAYNKLYPETYRSSGRRYSGRYKVDDYVDFLGMTVGEALSSPSRLFAPIVAKVLEKHRHGVRALVHNTGGGLTKCLRLGSRIHYVKDNLPEPDPIFILIKRESKASWGEMFMDFNMGVGYELVVKKEVAEDVIGVSESFKVGARIIGRCERSRGPNRLTVRSKYGTFTYTKT